MEQVAVIHTAFEDKPSTVAFVEVNDAETLTDKLEFAYRWTQNIMDSWSLKMLKMVMIRLLLLVIFLVVMV